MGGEADRARGAEAAAAVEGGERASLPVEGDGALRPAVGTGDQRAGDGEDVPGGGRLRLRHCLEGEIEHGEHPTVGSVQVQHMGRRQAVPGDFPGRPIQECGGLGDAAARGVCVGGRAVEGAQRAPADGGARAAVPLDAVRVEGMRPGAPARGVGHDGSRGDQQRRDFDDVGAWVQLRVLVAVGPGSALDRKGWSAACDHSLRPGPGSSRLGRRDSRGSGTAARAERRPAVGFSRCARGMAGRAGLQAETDTRLSSTSIQARRSRGISQCVSGTLTPPREVQGAGSTGAASTQSSVAAMCAAGRPSVRSTATVPGPRAGGAPRSERPPRAVAYRRIRVRSITPCSGVSLRRSRPRGGWRRD